MISDNARAGMQQAPARSLFNALGFTPEEMKKPMVGIVSSFNEIVPGHMNIDKIVEAVKLGVAEAGGVPVVFPAIAVCDGIAMGHVGMKYSLVTRDLIADSTECMAIAHQFDALVMVPNCVYRGGCPEFTQCGFWKKFVDSVDNKDDLLDINKRYEHYNRQFYNR